MEPRRLTRSTSDPQLPKLEAVETITVDDHLRLIYELASAYCEFADQIEREALNKSTRLKAQYDQQRDAAKTRGKKNHAKKDEKIRALEDQIRELTTDKHVLEEEKSELQAAFVSAYQQGEGLRKACSEAMASLEAARSLRDQVEVANTRNVAIIKNQQRAKKDDKAQYEAKLREQTDLAVRQTKEAALAVSQRNAAYFANEVLHKRDIPSDVRALFNLSAQRRDAAIMSAMNGNGQVMEHMVRDEPDFARLLVKKPREIFEELGLPFSQPLEKVIVYYIATADLARKKLAEHEENIASLLQKIAMSSGISLE
ncbi:uncharacterized protein B0I36DRAFT_349172 [Microdochium trichocladiopsis]|uniref:Uncharacterized protein n=1 Tax=Microdochium trichocladiopsis TaxID=1682393 RepID=A0A9P8Y6X5_9PEZI|nr:uncharacterized protein B0I36DRAFT_349172 [Microdochium trichocladiopsis]KAH7031033.1 hypothetical protein B0I36DRAFT_349172 [Microdochium trichocladiopsis]